MDKNNTFLLTLHSILHADVPAGGKYIGCFKDSGERALYETYMFSDLMTPDMCFKFCAIKVSN